MLLLLVSIATSNNLEGTGALAGNVAITTPFPIFCVNTISKCIFPKPLKGLYSKYPLPFPYAPALAIPQITSYDLTAAAPPMLSPFGPLSCCFWLSVKSSKRNGSPLGPWGPLNASSCAAVKSEYLNGSPLSPFGPLSALSWSCVKSEYLNGSPLGPGGPGGPCSPLGPFKFSNCSVVKSA